MVNRIRSRLLTCFCVTVLSAVTVTGSRAQGQQQQAKPVQHPLAWAYAVPEAPPPPLPQVDESAVKSIPGSTQSFTMKQIRDTGNPVDWFPNDHAPMPSIVAHRRSPTGSPWVGSCGLCHYPNGKGRPENAPVAGLPYGLHFGADCRL